MIIGTYAGGQAPRTNYNQTDPAKSDYLVGRENIASHIASESNPHGVTAEQVGAAPAGYGLGEPGARHLDITDISQLDDVATIGWYAFNLPEVIQLNGVYLNYAYMRVENWDTASLRQTLYVVNAEATVLTRRKYIGTWGEWECENPPMVIGVEYRTTERWNGRVVYTKLVNCQSAVNAGTAKLTDQDAIPIRWSGVLNNNIPLPMLESDFEANFCELSIYNNSGLECFVCCGGSAVGQNLKVQVWYVK